MKGEKLFSALTDIREEYILEAVPKKRPSSALRWCGLAACLAQDMDAALPPGKPMVVLLECDIAKALGLALREALGDRRKLICIDGVKVDQGDYVDMGKPVLDGMVIPLVVKTLLFGE